MANLIVTKGAVPKVTAKKTTTYEYNEIYDIRETDYVYNDSTETDWGDYRERPPHWNFGTPFEDLNPDASGHYYQPNTDRYVDYMWEPEYGSFIDPLGVSHRTIINVKLVPTESVGTGNPGIVSSTPSQAGAKPPPESPGHTRVGTIYQAAPIIKYISYDDGRFSETVRDGFCIVGDAIQHMEYKWTPLAVMKDYHYDEQGIEVIDNIVLEGYTGKGQNTSNAPSLLPVIIGNEMYKPEIKSHTITVSEVVT